MFHGESAASVSQRPNWPIAGPEPPKRIRLPVKTLDAGWFDVAIRDAIGSAVKRLKGYEYTISRPRDLWYAWTEIMSRIVKFRVGKSTPGASQ